MIKEKAKQVIQDTRMNRLVWDREDENNLVAVAELPIEGGKTESLPVRLQRYPVPIMGLEGIDKEYHLHIGDAQINCFYGPVREFGEQMFVSTKP